MDPNLDPSFHLNADLDLAPHQSDANLRPLVSRPSTASTLSIRDSPWLHNLPLKRLNIASNADPDPAFHYNADPDPTFQNNAEPDLYSQPW
jgi:hypothetical protein